MSDTATAPKMPTPDKDGLVSFRTKNRPHEEVKGTPEEWETVRATGFLHESGATTDEGAQKAEEKAQAEAAAEAAKNKPSGR